MKLMSMKQYSKLTKASLVRKIMKALKKLPKTKLIKLCYELEKRRLPTISTTKKNMPRLTARRAFKRRMPRSDTGFPRKPVPRPMRKAKPRSAKQKANDKRLGKMAKARAIKRRRKISKYPKVSKETALLRMINADAIRRLR